MLQYLSLLYGWKCTSYVQLAVHKLSTLLSIRTNSRRLNIITKYLIIIIDVNTYLSKQHYSLIMGGYAQLMMLTIDSIGILMVTNQNHLTAYYRLYFCVHKSHMYTLYNCIHNFKMFKTYHSSNIYAI